MRWVSKLLLWMLFTGQGLAGEPHGRGDATPGDLKTIVLNGSTTFTAQQVQRALRFNPDLLLARDRKAPHAAIVELIREKTLCGFRHAGFPQATVNAVVDPSGQVQLTVREGTRYRAGRIIIEGAAQIPEDRVRLSLTSEYPPRDAAPRFNQAGDTVWFDRDGKQAELQEPAWKRGEWVSFSASSQAATEARLREVLSDLGFPLAKFSVHIEPLVAQRTAQLRIRVQDEGRPAQIQRIQVLGNSRNSDEAILALLELQPGMIYSRQQRVRIEHTLWRSGRFAKYSTELVAPAFSDESYLLLIRVKECDQVSRVDEQLTAEEQVLLKARDWLINFERLGYDLVLEAAQSECVIAPRQGALIARRRAAGLEQAVILSGQRVSYFSFAQAQKLEFPPPQFQVVATALLEPAETPGRTIQFRLGVNVRSRAEDLTPPPAKLVATVAPAALLSMAHKEECSWDQGQLVLKVARAELFIDAETGRFSAKGGDSAESAWQLSFVRGAFAARTAEITRLAAALPNRFDPQRPISSTLEVLSREPLLLTYRDGQIAAAMAVIRTCGLLADAELFGPSDALFRTKPRARRESFTIPCQVEFTDSSGLALLAFALADELFLADSPPWLAWRAVTASLIGDERFKAIAKAGMRELARSDDNGPLVDLLMAKVFQGTPLAGHLARRALAHVSVADFLGSSADLIDNRFQSGRAVERLVDTMRRIDMERLDAATHGLPERYRGVTRDLVRFAHAHTATPTDELTRLLLEQLWVNGLRERVVDELQTMIDAGGSRVGSRASRLPAVR